MPPTLKILWAVFWKRISVPRRIRGRMRELWRQAEAAERQGSLDVATCLVEQYGELAQQYYGECHPRNTNSLCCLATLYMKKGHHTQAETLLKEVTDRIAVFLGRNNRYFAGSLHHLAVCCLCAGKHVQAESLAQQAAEILCKSEGEYDLQFANCLKTIGLALGAMGRHSEAERILSRVVSIYHTLLGRGHPECESLRSELAAIGTAGASDNLICKRVLAASQGDAAGRS